MRKDSCREDFGRRADGKKLRWLRGPQALSDLKDRSEGLFWGAKRGFCDSKEAPEALFQFGGSTRGAFPRGAQELTTQSEKAPLVNSPGAQVITCLSHFLDQL